MSQPNDLNVIGRRQPRLDGAEKCSGRSVFADDVDLPGMLCGKILRSSHAHARILSEGCGRPHELAARWRTGVRR